MEVLNLVKNLPDIVRLQCIMSRKLSRQLSSESAMKETIKKVTSKHFTGKFLLFLIPKTAISFIAVVLTLLTFSGSLKKEISRYFHLSSSSFIK